MHEFKHVASTTGLPRGDFDHVKMKKKALIHFRECPKVLTLARHTDLEEDTPVHCQRNDGVIIDYRVPRQNLQFLISKEGLRFSVVCVISSRLSRYWLVVCENYRKGFLVPYLSFKDMITE